MSSPFTSLAGQVTRRPRASLIVLGLVALALAVGMSLLAPQAGNEVFLPDDSEVARAGEVLRDSFPDTAGLSNTTVLHRGEFLTPEGLDHIDRVVAAAVADPAVSRRLALVDPVVSVSGAFRQVLGVDDLSTLSAEQIEAAASQPPLAALIDNLSGEAGGEALVISRITLREAGDADALEQAELDLAELVADVDGPLSVRALSASTVDEESAESSASSMQALMVLSLAVIAGLLFVFFRTGSDTALALAGLGITVVGTLGFQGLVGPDGVGLIGAPNSITSMVPIMLIGLVVDYSIQTVAHYRERRAEGDPVAEAARHALAGVMLPLGLAGGTTIISFLTNLTSSIPANGDFGIVAAFGVFFGLFTMLVLIPSARTLLDARREAAGKLGEPRLMADAIPGAGAVIERIGALVSARPAVVLAATGVVTVALGVAATQISTEFDSNDFLPGDGDSIDDIEALDEALGGQTEVVTVLIEAELTDDRTLRNMFSLDQAFGDELSRPTGAASDITQSLGTLFDDWITDSGEPGDNYDPELPAMVAEIDQGLTLDAGGVQAVLDRLAQLDPEGFAQVAVNDPDGEDMALVQFSALTGDQDRTSAMLDDLDGLWFGDRTQMTPTSTEVINLEVTEAMTEGQTTSIAVTIIAALVVLMLFFWLTEFKPMLAVIAVAPILLVLIWVLGSMTILGIPYNVVTALITALSIGIGVDYTIHVIHRFTEEVHAGRSLTEATNVTLSTTGSALVGSAVTTALAFAVLLLSPLVPFQQFGLVTGITILYALIVSVVVVPPLLIVWAAYHQWRAGMSV